MQVHGVALLPPLAAVLAQSSSWWCSQLQAHCVESWVP